MASKFKDPARIDSSMMENVTEYHMTPVGSDRIKIEIGTIVNSISIILKKKDAQNFAKSLYVAAGGKISL